MRKRRVTKSFRVVAVMAVVCTVLVAAGAQAGTLREETAKMRTEVKSSRAASWLRQRRTSDDVKIQAVVEGLAAAVASKDPDKIMEFYTPGDDLYVFDVVPSERYFGADTHRKNFEDFFATTPGPLTNEIRDLDIISNRKMAFAHYLAHLVLTDKDGNHSELMVRVTDCLQKIDGKWVIIHEHASVPVDLIKGAKPELMSEP